ncbi:uncharacterized protein LOC120280771 [Dioscorea cayenensis subsp. rotundata]|uniref:Uncharacterized protein LOC120280771 n=1 Tax=Dioscorea cayennensis subsp. rotundata TaxID=55577 RepID=A0AB40CW68_DIOCR|nr:uncharacterized protein LOC120280771 [Dioscorea cayenensis subsp. rotundata]
MEQQWLPLFTIFLNSPSPENEASLWFQQGLQLHPSPSSFLSLLLSPPSRSPNSIFFLTLPSFVQARILSFFAYDRRRFSPSILRILAGNVVRSSGSDFWVLRSARNLLDVLPLDDCQSLEPSREVEAEECGDVFYSLPHWLCDHAASTTPLLPWLPLSREHYHSSLQVKGRTFRNNAPRNMDFWPESVGNNQDDEIEISSPSLDVLGREKAAALKGGILALDSTAKAMHIAGEIRKLCVDYGTNNRSAILSLIEPWKADDETLSVLLFSLSNENDTSATSWSAHLLCSFVLPKYLVLNSPASRVLLSVTIGFCKLHPTAAVDAFLFPLTLRKEGINVVLCDVLSRIIRECLHPSHVSAFCQRLVCAEEDDDKECICLPCHRDCMSNELVWTESLFVLFQHILNFDVWLTPDTVDKLVSVISEKADKFSNSLKFGNFLLCFVMKCGNISKMHKDSLEKAVNHTDTFVTKSILSKLRDL